MSETVPAAAERNWLPQLRSRWWTVVLGLSLMLNLLVGGIILGGIMGPNRMERLTGASYVQLVPRGFFHDLPPERRKQIMQVIRDNRDGLRELRQASESTSVQLAEALEKEQFNIDDVKATVQAFSTGTESLAARGGDVVVKIIAQLTPEERRQLASSIRERAARAGRKH